MVHQRLLERPRLGQRIAGAQRHRLAVLDPVEAEQKGRCGEAVQRGDGRGQPLGRRIMEVVERDERDMEEVDPARRIVARQRGDLRLNLRRRLGHDVEGVPGAHGWECSMIRLRRPTAGRSVLAREKQDERRMLQFGFQRSLNMR